MRNPFLAFGTYAAALRAHVVSLFFCHGSIIYDWQESTGNLLYNK